MWWMVVWWLLLFKKKKKKLKIAQLQPWGKTMRR